MNFGIDVPISGDYSDPETLAGLASEAEGSGWDGFFIWDDIVSPAGEPMADPWVALAAIAMRTERIRIGPMVTPLPRRRPWKLARETVSIDHLSGGRLILGVGLGSPPEQFEQLGETSDARVRAGKLDEGLDILTGLWTGEPFSYAGEHYRLEETVFLPRPVQRPRIPVWVAAVWPNKAPLRRAARWDGVFPTYLEDGLNDMTPDILRSVVAYVRQQRSSQATLEVAAVGRPGRGRGVSDQELIADYTDAGLTWWIESVGPRLGSVEDSRSRIGQGPPRA